MRISLGIDTGGTFTDAVLYDKEKKQTVAGAKAPTTSWNLTEGMNAALAKLPADLLRQTEHICLSTTLATNACVENRGGHARLLLIGCRREVLAQVGAEYGLPPVSEISLLDGGHDRQGNVLREPDWDALRQMARELPCQAWAVSELYGARNPEYEDEACRVLQEVTGLPVVAGHTLTGELNSLRRAAGALLNARLLPVMEEFLSAVHQLMDRYDLHVPVAIVRGDGTLMTPEFARERPVETLICGPAASALGAARLSGLENALVADMGGTTSDLAMLRDGLPVMAETGASLAGWRTGVPSLDIETMGLGGDSLVTVTADGSIALGPRRVIPLVALAAQYPAAAAELERLALDDRKWNMMAAEFYMRGNGSCTMTGEQRLLWDALEGGPLSMPQLAGASGISAYHIHRLLAELWQKGAVARSALTPTDMLHALGKLSLWDDTPARNALAVLERFTGQEHMAEKICDAVSCRLFKGLARLLLRQRRKKELNLPEAYLDEVYADRNDSSAGDFLACGLSCRVPVVGVGAPVAFFLPEAAKALNCECKVDELSPVANALGAALAGVCARVQMIIKPNAPLEGPGYYAYGPQKRMFFDEYEPALAFAREEGKRLAVQLAQRMGCRNPQVRLLVKERRSRMTADGELLEAAVMADARGDMNWQQLWLDIP